MEADGAGVGTAVGVGEGSGEGNGSEVWILRICAGKREWGKRHLKQETH